jgi:hypothetical protein
MAHYDCSYCGGSLYDYPNCCQESQDFYIEGQKKKWARDKAKEQLRARHELEIMDLAKNWLNGKSYENDKLYFEIYLKEIKPIRGAKLR